MIKKEKLSISILILLSLIGFNVIGQSKKNSISVFYTPQITRTYFEGIIKNGSVPFKEFFETASSNRPITGYSYGIEYSRYFNKLELGLYIQENERGQRSEFAYNYRGSIPNDTLEGYGGLYYHLKIKSFSLGLNLGLELNSVENYNSYLQFNFGIDIYEIAFLEDFIIHSEDGSLQNGCCREVFLYYPYHHFSNILRRFEDGFYRADIGIAWRNKFYLFNNFYLEINPQFRFLTKILKSNLGLGTNVPNGIIWAIGIQTSLSFNF